MWDVKLVEFSENRIRLVSIYMYVILFFDIII